MQDPRMERIHSFLNRSYRNNLFRDSQLNRRRQTMLDIKSGNQVTPRRVRAAVHILHAVCALLFTYSTPVRAAVHILHAVCALLFTYSTPCARCCSHTPRLCALLFTYITRVGMFSRQV
jgi:hypothetical protein